MGSSRPHVLAALVLWAVALGSGVDAQTRDTPYPDVRRISLEDARALLSANRAVIVDVRDADEYRAGHIKGAVHIPAEQMVARKRELPAGKTVITYCS